MNGAMKIFFFALNLRRIITVMQETGYNKPIIVLIIVL